jgi:leader peptidase (prepilin peptidase)/N-methyltransferase
MLEMLAASPPLWIGCCAVLGLALGSFLNVVIHRVPLMMERQWRDECAELAGNEPPAESEPLNLFRPRSRCPSCGHAIAASENIPVVSWFALGGKCSACGTRISARYPAVEFATALLCGAAAWQFGFALATGAAIVLICMLTALAFIDADTTLLPDDITLPLLWIGLAFNLAGGFVPLREAVVGAMAGYLALWSIYWLFKLATGKEGMGYGDFKLLGALGAWFGWKALPGIILLSSVVGAALGIAMIAFSSRERDHQLPFGPYLAGAGVLALFFGRQINEFIFGGVF